MTITREEMIKKLSEKSGYYQKDIRILLQCLDEIVFEELCGVTDENDVSIQLVQGVKLQCVSVPERARKDPRDQSDIVCSSTCKIKAKFSQDLKLKLAEAYENNKNG
jgi:nucleoid DNA-binding protein